MIREFSFNDIDSVNKLLKVLDYKLEEKSFNNDFLKILIFDDEIIKGVLIYQDLIDSLTIDYLVVDENYRKCGIATKLLNFMEENYKDYNNITLEVRESNIPAINFYKKNGFIKAAKRKNYYKEEDGILMVKELR